VLVSISLVTNMWYNFNVYEKKTIVLKLLIITAFLLYSINSGRNNQ